jgi:CarD family transcriptional regulator
MRYTTNDTVLYDTRVCKILEISERDFRGQRIEYYALKPLSEFNATIFIPVGNEALTAKMRRVLSVEEIHALIRAIPQEKTIWIDDELARRERYRKILEDGDPMELLRLIKTLYLRGQSQKDAGKKAPADDTHFMNDAEKILYEEFAHVLDIKRDQVLPFILEQIAYS